MIINREIRYSVDLVLPRKRNVTQVNVEESVPVSLREVATDDVDLVARYRHPRAEYDSSLRADLVWFEGAFWRTDVTRENNRHRHQRMDDLLASLEGRALTVSDDYIAQHQRVPSHTPQSLAALPVREIRDSRRDAALQAAAEEAAELLVIDGTVFEKTVEPVLNITYFGMGDSGTISISSDTGDNARSLNIFRLDQLSNAHAVLDGRVRESGALVDYEARLAIEVFRPDLLKMETELRALRLAAETYVGDFDQAFLQAATREALNLFVTLRDLAKDPESDPDALAAAAGALLENDGDARFYASRMLGAVKMWNDVVATRNVVMGMGS